MTTGRLEAFSDGVLAIIITIMVLELKVPHGDDFHSISLLLPKILNYILSFIYVGVYWNNHHHLFQAITKINGAILWANLHLLFWLSLLPVATGWMGEHYTDEAPVAIYGAILLLCSIAFAMVEKAALKFEGKESNLAKSLGNQRKELISVVGYLLGIGSTIVYPQMGIAVYFLIALMWIIPDKRIEKILT
ncbi:DUF1211 domain-containing protein [Sphingobacterium shayense]|uniref:TMEM175 family protein n=1 Tax=Sphingobacterium shayense TaxID=626343 RepID=UPI001556EB2A|nr:TMEM175 family protein [Sphingobacterium shayense]NQD69624.1 DUF1211 domain-containing protein [Sphingobacterium shayense]